MKTATLCFLLRNDEVCLGLKKRGIGEGKYNGFGGKVGDKEEFKDESISDAAIREVREEAGVKVRDLEKVGEIEFVFPEKPEWGQRVHVFISKDWEGEPIESEEMRPEWFSLDQIPYDKMWWDDQYWLPKVLNGEVIEAYFEFDKDERVTKHEIKIVGKAPERK